MLSVSSQIACLLARKSRTSANSNDIWGVIDVYDRGAAFHIAVFFYLGEHHNHERFETRPASVLPILTICARFLFPKGTIISIISSWE
jgi:hypothetical protein